MSFSDEDEDLDRLLTGTDYTEMDQETAIPEPLQESVGAGESLTKDTTSASGKPTQEEGGRELRTAEELSQVLSLLSCLNVVVTWISMLLSVCRNCYFGYRSRYP